MGKKKSDIVKDKLQEVPEEKVKEPKKKDKIAEAVETLKNEFGFEVEPVKNTSYKINRVIEHITSKYDFRYNIINKETEFKKKSEKEYRYFEDCDFRDLSVELDLNNLAIAENKFRNLIYGSSISERYNPFVDYFNKIGECDSEYEYEGPKAEKKFKRVKSGNDYIKEFCSQVILSGDRKLKHSIDENEIEIYLNNIEGLPFSGEVFIDDEVIKYSLEKDGSKIIVLERGYKKTKASSHKVGANIYLPIEKENREYFVEGFRKWFVALVVSLRVDIPHKHFINQVCLVLLGGQGKLKSTWLENIVPASMRMKYIYSSHFDTRLRDHLQFLATHILIILEEMAALNKNDIESIKGTLTETKFAGRLSYDKEKTYLKRRASFAATQNNKEFLKDESGSRRWFVVEIESIAIDKDFEIDKMYSQGLRHFKDGLKYWFDNDDIKIQEAKNEQFKLKTFEFELVEKHYEVPDKDNSEDSMIRYLSSTDIAVKLSKDNNINVNNTVKGNIGKALASLGFKKVSMRLAGKPVKLWYVKEALDFKIDPIDDALNNHNKKNEIF